MLLRPFPPPVESLPPTQVPSSLGCGESHARRRRLLSARGLLAPLQSRRTRCNNRRSTSSAARQSASLVHSFSCCLLTRISSWHGLHSLASRFCRPDSGCRLVEPFPLWRAFW